jgi:DNA-binding HxlR family transcriptional regulator
MTATRTYGQACSAAHALDLVGERWGLLVVRELLLGPKRFTDLRSGLPHASANVLAQRLRELEDAGVVRRRKLAPPAGSSVYELTEWGLELEPVLVGLARWGGRSPLRDLGAGASVDALMLAVRSRFDPERAGDLNATYALRIGEHAFTVRVDGGRLSIGRQDAGAPNTVLEGDDMAFAALLTGQQTVDQLRAAKRLTVSGDAKALQRLLDALPTPAPAPLP